MKLRNLAVVFFIFCFFKQQSLCAVVEVEDNAALTAEKKVVGGMFPVLNAREAPSFHPGIPLPELVQRNTAFFDGDPLYSTVRISCRLNAIGRPARSFSGTGFFVIDRSKATDGVYRPLNLSVSESWNASKTFPRVFLVTNKHVLNAQSSEITRENTTRFCCIKSQVNTTFVKSSYIFEFHLMKAQNVADNRGIQTKSGQFKTAFVAMPLTNLDIHHLPDDVSLQPGTSASIDLAAIDVGLLFEAIRDHISNDPSLTGFEPFFSAFDTIESFKEIPQIGASIEMVGYPLGKIQGGRLPGFVSGLVSSNIPKVETFPGSKARVVDGYCGIDIASGTSGSPVFYKEQEAVTTQLKLIGVAFASNNEDTHSLGRIIFAKRVKDLIKSIVTDPNDFTQASLSADQENLRMLDDDSYESALVHNKKPVLGVSAHLISLKLKPIVEDVLGKSSINRLDHYFTITNDDDVVKVSDFDSFCVRRAIVIRDMFYEFSGLDCHYIDLYHTSSGNGTKRIAEQELKNISEILLRQLAFQQNAIKSIGFVAHYESDNATNSIPEILEKLVKSVNGKWRSKPRSGGGQDGCVFSFETTQALTQAGIKKASKSLEEFKNVVNSIETPYVVITDLLTQDMFDSFKDTFERIVKGGQYCEVVDVTVDGTVESPSFRSFIRSFEPILRDRGVFLKVNLSEIQRNYIALIRDNKHFKKVVIAEKDRLGEVFEEIRLIYKKFYDVYRDAATTVISTESDNSALESLIQTKIPELPQKFNVEDNPCGFSSETTASINVSFV